MNNSSHPNSKLVTIFRANNFVQQAQNPDTNTQVADWMSLSNKNIGPYFQSNSTKIIGSGLTLPEQKLLMPHIIRIVPTDVSFPIKVYEYFNELVTKVPFSGGKTFQIGLIKDNDKPVGEENMPIDIEDYIRWRHAKNHPWVAGSYSDAKGNQLKFFYMDDPEATLKEDTDKLVLQDKADTLWLGMKDQADKVSMMLTLMGGDPREYAGLRNAEQRMRNDLRSRINKNVSLFISLHEDSKFETKYWLKAMLNANVVKKLGNAYIYGDNKTPLGYSEDESILFLENPNNADTLLLLKGMAQDVLKKSKSKSTLKASAK